jgi:hypothetical protein
MSIFERPICPGRPWADGVFRRAIRSPVGHAAPAPDAIVTRAPLPTRPGHAPPSHWGQVRPANSMSDAEIAKVNITRHDFHGDWNYTINPRSATVIKS